VLGALRFKHAGFISVVPPAVLPIILALVPILSDIGLVVAKR
jgi:hypothetical protein